MYINYGTHSTRLLLYCINNPWVVWVVFLLLLLFLNYSAINNYCTFIAWFVCTVTLVSISIVHSPIAIFTHHSVDLVCMKLCFHCSYISLSLHSVACTCAAHYFSLTPGCNFDLVWEHSYKLFISMCFHSPCTFDSMCSLLHPSTPGIYMHRAVFWWLQLPTRSAAPIASMPIATCSVQGQQVD